MIKHFAADGSVKNSWSDAVHVSPIVRGEKLLYQVQGSNFVLAEVELAEGEQIGDVFASADPAVEASAPGNAVDVFVQPGAEQTPEAAAVTALQGAAPVLKEVLANPSVVEELHAQGQQIAEDHPITSTLQETPAPETPAPIAPPAAEPPTAAAEPGAPAVQS